MNTSRRNFLAFLGIGAAGIGATASVAVKDAAAAGYPGIAVETIRDKNVLLRVDNYAGKPVVNFRGIPIRLVKDERHPGIIP